MGLVNVGRAPARGERIRESSGYFVVFLRNIHEKDKNLMSIQTCGLG